MTERLYVTPLPIGSEFLGKVVEECPLCHKPAVRLDLKVETFVHSIAVKHRRFLRDQFRPDFYCESRVVRPGLFRGDTRTIVPVKAKVPNVA